MTRTDETITMTSGEFAHLGEGSVAYLRKVSSDDLRGRFPGLDEIAPGLELWALFPSLLGALVLATRWRIGPVLYLLGLFWLALADKAKVSPLELVPYVLSAVLRLPTGMAPGAEADLAPQPRMHNDLPILDMFQAVAVLLYVAAHYRFLSVTRNLFPLDRRRRLRQPDPARPKRIKLASLRVRGENPWVPTCSDSSRFVLPAPFGPTTSTSPGSSSSSSRAYERKSLSETLATISRPQGRRLTTPV